MSRIIDRYLKKGHNQALYFVVSLIRLVVISGGFYLAIRVARHAVIFYILGLLVTIAALFTEAVMQLFRRTATCKNIKS